MRKGGLILAAGRARWNKKNEITGNLIVAHTKKKQEENNSTYFPGVFDAGGC